MLCILLPQLSLKRKRRSGEERLAPPAASLPKVRVLFICDHAKKHWVLYKLELEWRPVALAHEDSSACELYAPAVTATRYDSLAGDSEALSLVRVCSFVLLQS